LGVRSKTDELAKSKKLNPDANGQNLESKTMAQEGLRIGTGGELL
jgi:hypothetical protein